MSKTEELRPSDLKSILHSKRANLYYLEHCRVLVKGGRVEYVTDAGRQSLYWNIPIANNRASADFMISSPLMDKPYDRLVPDYDNYATRKIDWGEKSSQG